MSTATAFKVFAIPEISSTICSFLKLKSCVPFMLASKLHFQIALPFVWNTGILLPRILRLIPGTTTAKTSDRKIALTLPPVDQADFSRFDIYSPHIRQLIIHTQLIKTQSWNTLIQRSNERPLLPKLSHITMWQDEQTDLVTRELVWMSIFLTASVTPIHIQSQCNISSYLVSTLGLHSFLEIISNRCPHVHELWLPSTSPNTQGASEEHHLVNIFSTRPVSSCILSLLNLRELRAGLWIFQPEYIGVLGTLPSLTHLTMLAAQQETIPSAIAVLKEASFSSLKELALNGLQWDGVECIMGYPIVLRNVASLRLNLPPSEETAEQANTIVPLLLGKTLNLRTPCSA